MFTNRLIYIGIKAKIVKWKQIKKISRHIIYYPFIPALKLIVFFAKHRVDIVNANSFNAMAVVAPIAKLYKIPIIWTCHGWWPTGKASGIFINNFVDKIIAVSGFVKNKLVKEGFVNPNKIIQIPLGINLSNYSRSSSGEEIRREFRISKDAPLVGMIGRFQKIKGHHIFIKMASEIIKTNPNVCFMIVGSEMFGENEENKYEKEIRELICKSGIEEKFILTGFRQDVPQILKALDVLVVPSEIETFGMVVLEAMAMGVPVVNCARGGPTEIIIDGENGYNVSGQDPIKLGEKVKYLIDHPDIRSAMGIAGEKTVKQKYSIEEQITKIEKIYGHYLS
jgi:glycosyltransferase involved in cell wall biosynthesis